MEPASRPADSGPAYLRVAGRTALDGRRLLVWSVAEGSRGRRWRATVSAGGRLVAVVLLEVKPSGRPARLELATVEGMVTLHPEPDEDAIHGNVVHGAGVHPLAFGWSPDHELDLAGLPFGLAVAASRRAGTIGVGEGATFPTVRVGEDLAVGESRARIARLTSTTWRIERETGEAREMTVDEHGLIGADAIWELEPGDGAPTGEAPGSPASSMWEARGQHAPGVGPNRETRG